MAAIPSPLSTGHAGPSYEQHLGAAFLVILLTGGMMPMASDKALKEVHFQTRHLGWATDDLLLVGETVAGTEHRIAIQAKRTFILREADEDCVKTLRAAWDDFKNETLFKRDRDKLALVTGEAPSNFSRGMRAILDAAQASLDAQDFIVRRSKYFSKEAGHCYDVVCQILRAHAGSDATDETFWRFLRVWDFTVLDFHSASGVAEALVKGLLAAAATGPTVQANETWNSLLSLVAKDASRARSFDWATLPSELRQQYRMPTVAQREASELLRVVSTVVRDGLDGRLANKVALPRPEIVANGLAMIGEMDALLVTGPAGCGKSVVASMIYDVMAAETLAVAFRADTLATPHLATSALNIGLQLRSLMRLFALHSQKLFWIESAERLFEKSRSEREAFMDLLRLLVRDRGWKLLITCREYSAERLRVAFLETVGLRTNSLSVPDLSDDEFAGVIEVLPQLRTPLAEPTLRDVLRNPFFLNLAARMNWPAHNCAAMNRRTFREKAWREVICADDEPADGMPLERERAMIEIALRRARALTPYVPVDHIHPPAVHALERDSLLSVNSEDHSQFTPSHDVYEDWALFRWLQRLRESQGTVNANFFHELGAHPAMRRAFRLWLLELLDAVPAEGEQLVLSMMNDLTLSGYWRDEALVAVLQSNGAAQVLLRLEPALCADNGAPLRRAIHLLRVACRKPPVGVGSVAGASAFFLLPEGSAWDAMPLLLVKARSFLNTTDIPWLLRFLEDWATGAKQRSQPKGAEMAAMLCDLLLSCLEYLKYEYRRIIHERVLKVMLRIPRAADQQLRSFVEKACADDTVDFEDKLILKLICNHFAGDTVCREMPDITVRVAESSLRLGDKFGHRKEGGGQDWEFKRVESVFGLGHRSSISDFPESAWQGPFLNLLTHHSKLGVDLVLRLANQCCAQYASTVGVIEAPFEVELVLEDGSCRRQWANDRLWRLYRGTSVGPHILQSALMALEAWLLQKGERGDDDLRDIFSQLLSSSNNVSISAVLVSLALAYPHLIAESGVPLLSEPWFFDAELARALSDQTSARSTISEMLPTTDGENILLEGERRESGKKPHRCHNLEVLAVMLQWTPARPKVWALIDRYLTRLPTEADQNERDLIWRLRLHRIDVRNFGPTGESDDGRIMYSAGPAAPELEEFKGRGLPVHQERDRRLWLYFWGVHVFDSRDSDKFLSNEWRERLAEVKSLPPDPETDLPLLFQNSGAPQIAAVCLRDHWEALRGEDLAWCGDAVCRELESLPDLGIFAAGMMDASYGVTAAAQVVSLIVAKSNDSELRARAQGALSLALLHPERSISQSAANGMGTAFFELDRKTILGGVNALLEWAAETKAFRSAQRQLPGEQRREAGDFDRELRSRLCAEWSSIEFDETRFFSTDFLRWPGLRVMLPILGIFGRAHTDSLAVRIYVHLSHVLLDSWRSDGTQRGYAGVDAEVEEIELRFQERLYLSEALARFALACPEEASRLIVEPLAAVADKYPEGAAEFVKQLVYCEDRRSSGGRFWLLWQIWADAVLAFTKDESDTLELKRLIDALFLGISWKPEACEWEPLSGQSSRILNFFRSLPSSQTTVTSFTILAGRFRSELIPASLPAFSEKLSALSDRTFISHAAINSLESIFESLIYTGTTEIRSRAELRTATLNLLDMLVEAGSSAAFALRDDFLTPLRS